jgi:hypothetical protein
VNRKMHAETMPSDLPLGLGLNSRQYEKSAGTGSPDAFRRGREECLHHACPQTSASPNAFLVVMPGTPSANLISVTKSVSLLELQAMDLDRLLKLRLIVARCGEMDMAKWWDTNGLLGPRGALVFRRGLPRTHHFAQARVVFEVARARCSAVFDPPGGFTLWSLPADREEQFDTRWQEWLDHDTVWEPLFQKLAAVREPDLIGALRLEGLLSDMLAERVARFGRSAEGRAILVPGATEPTDEAVSLLAAAFSHSGVGQLAVPYARLGG